MKSRMKKRPLPEWCSYSDMPSPDAYRNLHEVDRTELSDDEIDRVIEMAWEDRTPFEAIQAQWDLCESDVLQLMRTHLKSASYKRWRARVNSGVSQKHAKLRLKEVTRFRCSRQRAVSANRISKR